MGIDVFFKLIEVGAVQIKNKVGDGFLLFFLPFNFLFEDIFEFFILFMRLLITFPILFTGVFIKKGLNPILTSFKLLVCLV